jgi:hypothetical protein
MKCIPIGGPVVLIEGSADDGNTVRKMLPFTGNLTSSRA